MEYLETNKERLSKINRILFSDIWRNDQLNQEQKELLKDLVQNNYVKLYGRKINGNIINIGLNHPSTHEIDDQTLMFGPAGNSPECPEIIISGISTSITAANGIAESLKEKDLESLKVDDIREIYLNNIYKGFMYNNFKRDWEARSNQSIYENDFLELFEMIEGKKTILKESKIMVTQATLHGIATYYYDKRHERISWSAPSTKVFNSEMSELLYNDFFIESVVIERFINNPKSKYLFLMGDAIFRKVKKTLLIYEKINPSNSLDNVIFCDNIEKEFKLKSIGTNINSKYIIKVKHSAA